jgi:uncharacterized SAM-binding protein YcdF (DUF218 family)
MPKTVHLHITPKNLPFFIVKGRRKAAKFRWAIVLLISIAFFAIYVIFYVWININSQNQGQEYFPDG